MSQPKQPCNKCGVILNAYWLKDGICNGCRNPDRVVHSVPLAKSEPMVCVTRIICVNRKHPAYLKRGYIRRIDMVTGMILIEWCTWADICTWVFPEDITQKRLN